MRTIFILLSCCALAVAAPPHHKQSKDQAAPTEILPWDEPPAKDAGKEKHAETVWSCSRNCNEITGDESWLLTLDLPHPLGNDSAPFGSSSKTGLPLERQEFRQEAERKHLALYQWLLRRARKVSSKHLARAAVVAKWANGMVLEITGTQKDGFASHTIVWKEPKTLAAAGIATAPEELCAGCQEKDRQIEKLTLALAKARGTSRVSRNDTSHDRQRD
jgi:hypothetical protein